MYRFFHERLFYNLILKIYYTQKSLVVPVTWLALIGAIYSRIAPIFALNRIFFPVEEQATLKTNNQTSRLV